MIEGTKFSKEKIAAILLLSIFCLMSVISLRAMNVLSFTPFELTGWDLHNNFTWGWDLFWVPLYVLGTSLIMTVGAWTLGLIRNKEQWRTWLRAITILAICRIVFAFTTWDTALLWKWLYPNDVTRTWIPWRLHNAFFIGYMETLMFGILLCGYFEFKAINEGRSDFISKAQIVIFSFAYVCIFWLYSLSSFPFDELLIPFFYGLAILLVVLLFAFYFRQTFFLSK